jgi:hypothetical protein
MDINTELLAQVCEGAFYIALAVVAALGIGFALGDWIVGDKEKK